MALALEAAKRAFDEGEVPVGAVIVKNGEVVSSGQNRRETGKNALYQRVVYGATDYRFGSVRSVQRIFDLPYNHRPEVTAGVLSDDCTALMQAFFRKLRGK